jgi:hypothetical protein
MGKRPRKEIGEPKEKMAGASPGFFQRSRDHHSITQMKGDANVAHPHLANVAQCL